MIGKSYIDGLDIYTQYGVFITNGGHADIAAFPALKKPEINDWQEEDGIEVDLTSPALDSRTIQIPFAAHKAKRVKEFITKLTDGANHAFDFRLAGQTLTLRLTGQSEIQITETIIFFTLQFVDDQPLKEYTYTAPVATTPSPSGFTLDGKELSEYGVWVLAGMESSLRKTPEVKENLLRGNAGTSGMTYDAEAVTFKAREATIRMRMAAPDLATFWRNHKALLYDLTRPGTRELYAPSTQETHKCYYSKASVESLSLTPGKIRCDFSITLVLISTRIPI